MPRTFNVPEYYRSSGVLAVKQQRHRDDPKKRDLRPTILDFGPVHFHLARHFGFCFGVENAIEIAYRVLEDNPGKQVYLLSEMIHNPLVNADLLSRGVRFLMKTDGTRLVDFKSLQQDDIVVVPAFGTTVELQRELEELGINPYRYDATCPFVEKVWKRADDLGRKGFTIIVHGKRSHEETRATFSHSKRTAATLVVRDMAQAQGVIDFIHGRTDVDTFYSHFSEAISEGFDPERDLQKIGVVNQTTMLATETKAIAEAFRQAMLKKYGEESLKEHYADTRDTLCYATYENQSATRELAASGADLALVVGGYNSSNTSHLVELLEEHMPTYYISAASEIIDREQIAHFDLHSRERLITRSWLPAPSVTSLRVAVTAGASCPDSSVDAVLQRIAGFFPQCRAWPEVLELGYTLPEFPAAEARTAPNTFN